MALRCPSRSSSLMALLSKMNKNILGLDYGDARIGVAIASTLAKLPNPYAILKNDGLLFYELAAIAKRENIQTIVIGLPRNASGEETEQTRIVRVFAKELQDNIDIPIKFADESLSSRRAEEMNKQQFKRPNGEPLDDLAACFILEEFLKRENYASEI